jgi:uncharacterized membrane protein
MNIYIVLKGNFFKYILKFSKIAKESFLCYAFIVIFTSCGIEYMQKQYINLLEEYFLRSTILINLNFLL